jgi:hypothetical protein
MPNINDSLHDRLARYRELTITVTGRKSGRQISNPVWFVFEKGKLELLPVTGKWIRNPVVQNVVKNPRIRIDARGGEAELQVVPVTDSKKVTGVVEKFREKYGAGDVKKYYPNFDVAVVAQMP